MRVGFYESEPVSEYRNKKLLALAKESPQCFMCGADNDGTVVAAHSDSQAMGKGMGYKSSDLPAFLCHECHSAVDGRNKMLSNREERQSAWAKAAVLSLRWVLINHPEVMK